MARQGGLRVTAVHVLDSSSIAFRTASGAVDEGGGVLEQQARNRLEALILKESLEVEVDIVIRRGRPVDELRNIIEERQSPLLVISANDLTKERLGSIAARCVRSAPCDVLVLRDWQEGNFDKVVVCTDFSAVSGRVLERGMLLAKENHAELQIVHVMYPPSKDLWGEVVNQAKESTSSFEEECKANVKRDMEKFLSDYSEGLAKIQYQSVMLESESSSTALTFFIREIGADLVVMGTRGHSKLASHYIGTNAERLMHDATVSVYATRV